MKRGALMIKFINKLNCFFIHEEDERASFSDYFIFYGHLALSIILLIVFTILNITF